MNKKTGRTPSKLYLALMKTEKIYAAKTVK